MDIFFSPSLLFVFSYSTDMLLVGVHVRYMSVCLSVLKSIILTFIFYTYIELSTFLVFLYLFCHFFLFGTFYYSTGGDKKK